MIVKRNHKLADLLKKLNYSIAVIKDPYTEDRMLWVVDALESLAEVVAVLMDTEVSDD